MRILVLVDGLHTREVLESLATLIRMQEAQLLLAYVRPAGPRSGLELMSRRPGHGTLPPHRREQVAEAESERGAQVLAEAEEMAARHTPSVESIQLEGEAGRATCDVAMRRKADLVVLRVGGRDRPPLGARALGPTARYIAEHCASPVLLLRPRA